MDLNESIAKNTREVQRTLEENGVQPSHFHEGNRCIWVDQLHNPERATKMAAMRAMQHAASYYFANEALINNGALQVLHRYAVPSGVSFEHK